MRRNEILRLVEAGLEDISVSRAGQSWGIPLPFDPQSVVYVWFDALINYAAAVGYGWDDERFAKWWPADLHIIGKDITRFHCVIWPAMLMSAKLPLPAQVFGHGWISVDGQRMSKSLGTVVDPIEAAERFGVDPLRLYLVEGSAVRRRRRFHVGAARREVQRRPRQQSRQPREPRVGDDRALSRRAAGADARVRAAGRRGRDGGRRLSAAMDRLALHEGVAAAFRIVDATNLFIADTQPWALAKDRGAGGSADRGAGRRRRKPSASRRCCCCR